MTRIRLINYLSTSVSNPIMKKHMVRESMDICGEFNVVGGVGGVGVSISQECGLEGWWVGGWVAGMEVGG